MKTNYPPESRGSGQGPGLGRIQTPPRWNGQARFSKTSARGTGMKKGPVAGRKPKKPPTAIREKQRSEIQGPTNAFWQSESFTDPDTRGRVGGVEIGPAPQKTKKTVAKPVCGRGELTGMKQIHEATRLVFFQRQKSVPPSWGTAYFEPGGRLHFHRGEKRGNPSGVAS